MLDTCGVGDLAPSAEQLEEFASSSLFVVGRVYTRRSNGDLQFTGTRPGPGWVGHGYFWRWLWVLRCGELIRIRLWKRRWKHPSLGTCHSRPPDEMGRISVCSLVYVLALFGWLSARCGLEDVTAQKSGAAARQTGVPPGTFPQAGRSVDSFVLGLIWNHRPRPEDEVSGRPPPRGPITYGRPRWGPLGADPAMARLELLLLPDVRANCILARPNVVNATPGPRRRSPVIRFSRGASRRTRFALLPLEKSKAIHPFCHTSSNGEGSRGAEPIPCTPDRSEAFWVTRPQAVA